MVVNGEGFCQILDKNLTKKTISFKRFLQKEETKRNTFLSFVGVRGHHNENFVPVNRIWPLMRKGGCQIWVKNLTKKEFYELFTKIRDKRDTFLPFLCI